MTLSPFTVKASLENFILAVYGENQPSEEMRAVIQKCFYVGYSEALQTTIRLLSEATSFDATAVKEALKLLLNELEDYFSKLPRKP